MLTLHEFAARYVGGRRISAMYAATVCRRARALEAFTGSSPLGEVLTEPHVNAFLLSLDRSLFTIRSYRSDLLALWNAAADLDLVPYPNARRIYCPQLPSLLVECYEISEVRTLLGCVDELTRVYRNGVPQRAYWQAAIRLAWDTGLRRGDVLAFRRASVRPDGTARVVQRKTGKPIMVKLRPSTVAALDAVGRPTPCDWPLDASFFGRHFRKIVSGAGVHRGSFRWLRRASGSYVEWEHPGAGRKHLGHSSQQVFDRHYDAQLGGHALPLPPEL